MGIEPTSHMISMRPNGFEDRAGHQPWFHFRVEWQVKIAMRGLTATDVGAILP